MYKFINAEMTPKKREQIERVIFYSYLTLYVTCVVFFNDNWTFLKKKIMSAYNITEFLRIAYQPFAYCVPSKSPLNTAYQGGCHPQL